LEKIIAAGDTLARAHQQFAIKLKDEFDTPISAFRDNQKRLYKQVSDHIFLRFFTIEDYYIYKYQTLHMYFFKIIFYFISFYGCSWKLNMTESLKPYKKKLRVLKRYSIKIK